MEALIDLRGKIVQLVSSFEQSPDVAIDRIEARRKIAIQCGADFVFEPNDASISHVAKATEGRGADSLLELVGLPDAQSLAYQLIRPGGVMSVIGCHSAPNFAFSPAQAYDKNLTYRTGRCPARHYMTGLTQCVQRSDVQIDHLITHRFAPQDCVAAYDIFAHQKQGCIKAILTFEG